MSDGDTTNLGPRLDTGGGPRFSIIDMGSVVGPGRMDTRGMLKSEMRSVYENHSLVQTLNRAMADPGEAVINLLKPLIVLVALVIGFIGAALILESQAIANSPAETAAPVPEPKPMIAAASIDEEEVAEPEEIAEPEEELVEETNDETETAAVEPALDRTPEPRKVRKARKVKRSKKRHKRSKKRRKRSKRRRR
jgi:hypothetical protein